MNELVCKNCGHVQYVDPVQEELRKEWLCTNCGHENGHEDD